MSQRRPDLNPQSNRDDLEETLAKMAAMRIANRELDTYDAADGEGSDLSKIPGYQSTREGLYAELIHAEHRYQKKKFFQRVRRFVACLALASVLTTGVLYITVDAARNTINNFFLELHDGYAILHSDEDLDGIRAPLPEDWAGPVTPHWVPKRFTQVTATEMRHNSQLIYTASDSTDVLTISFWSEYTSPQIDYDELLLKRTLKIGDVDAYLYVKAESKILGLSFTVHEMTIYIHGNVSENEIIKVAENISI